MFLDTSIVIEIFRSGENAKSSRTYELVEEEHTDFEKATDVVLKKK